MMNLYRSTISRELSRDHRLCSCRSKEIHPFLEPHARACEKGRRIADHIWGFVDGRLAKFLRPDQIRARLEERGMPLVSNEGIYNCIDAEKRKGGTLHRAVRYTNARIRRHSSGQRRAIIPNQMSIDQFPAIVTALGRASDREAVLALIATNR